MSRAIAKAAHEQPAKQHAVTIRKGEAPFFASQRLGTETIHAKNHDATKGHPASR